MGLGQVTEPHLQVLEKEYEALRRRKTYQEPRLTHRFLQRDLDSFLKTGPKEVTLEVTFSRDMVGEEKWKEYGTQLLKFHLALTKRRLLFPFLIEPKSLGYRITIPHEPEVLNAIFYPSSLQFAQSPIVVTNHRMSISGDSALPFNLEKRPWSDFITDRDLLLVEAYYQRIGEVLYEDLEARGLTVYTAQKKGEGPSIIRRNDKFKERLVVREPNDLRTLIEAYQAFRFVPDVNQMKSYVIDRVPIDLDRPPTMAWKVYSEFVNDFTEWLRGTGFHPRLRLTGGMGSHIILDLKVDRVASAYTKPFPRELKFDTWYYRVGESGLIGSQASDFVRLIGIAFGIHRKEKLGKKSPITIENHDVSQRYWNIFVDYTRAKKDMGVVSVGSIHHETGGVCMPVSRVPEEFTVQKVIESSFDPSTQLRTYDPKTKSKWIQLVGENPHLLYEERRPESFELIEEAFEKWSWIPAKYIQLGPDSFMQRYCW